MAELYSPKGKKNPTPSSPQPTRGPQYNACKSGVPKDMKRPDRLLRDFSGEKK